MMIDARKHVAAFVTIGQSPRDDMVDEIVSIIDRDGFSLPPGAFVQYGALDLVDEAGVADLFPRRGANDCWSQGSNGSDCESL